MGGQAGLGLAVAVVAIGQQPRDVTEVLLGEGQDLQSQHGAIVRHDASPRKRLPGSTWATDDWGSSVSDLLSPAARREFDVVPSNTTLSDHPFRAD